MGIGAGLGGLGGAASKPVQQAAPAPRFTAPPAPPAQSVGAGLSGAAAPIAHAGPIAQAYHASPPSSAGRGIQAAGQAIAQRAQVKASQLRAMQQQRAALVAAYFRSANRMSGGDPFESVLNYSQTLKDYQQPLGQMMASGELGKDFSALQQKGLLPKSAKLPDILFADQSNGTASSADRSVSLPKGMTPPRSFTGAMTYPGSGGNRSAVYLSPFVVDALQRFAGTTGADQAFARGALVHELAHTAQNPTALSNRTLTEGGAAAFANAAVPQVVGPLPGMSGSDVYTRLAQQVQRLGPNWYMKGQFNR